MPAPVQSEAGIGVQHSTAAEITLMVLTQLASLLDLLLMLRCREFEQLAVRPAV